MSSDKLARDPFLAAIEAKIAAWKAVADTYKAAVAGDSPLVLDAATVAQISAARPLTPLPAKPTELPVGVFRDKTIKDAIVVYLTAVQRKQTNKQIADGLRAGGIATTSKNFEPTVGTALHRLKKDGIILRFNDGWDLAASYPDSLRGRLEKDRKPRTRKAKAEPTMTIKVKKRKPKESASENAGKAEPLRAVV